MEEGALSSDSSPLIPLALVSWELGIALFEFVFLRLFQTTFGCDRCLEPVAMLWLWPMSEGCVPRK